MRDIYPEQGTTPVGSITYGEILKGYYVVSACGGNRTYTGAMKKPGRVTPGFVRSLVVLYLRVLVGRAVLRDQMSHVLVEYELVIFLNRRSPAW